MLAAWLDDLFTFGLVERLVPYDGFGGFGGVRVCLTRCWAKSFFMADEIGFSFVVRVKSKISEISFQEALLRCRSANLLSVCENIDFSFFADIDIVFRFGVRFYPFGYLRWILLLLLLIGI